ncbi:MAG: ABC transporter ATP-binding protein [Chloroflexota bacterium]
MIELKDISKIYRMGKVEVRALNGLSLTINDGELVAIVGASGSGKSTLLHIIGCIAKPTMGRYILDGADVSRLNDNQLANIRSRKIGFVFQDFNLLPRATALANVELPLIYSGGRSRRARAIEALSRVGLTERMNHRPTELSGGEQQRVAVARALINRPPIIVADEPTGNLDSISASGIVSLLCGLNGEGITVILVTHEMDIANQTRRIIRLKDGNIISDELGEGCKP